MRALAVIPLAFVAGAIASRIALRWAPAAIHASILSQPLPVATDWGAFGAVLWCVAAVTLAIAAGTYVAALRGAPGLSIAAVLASGAAALCAAWLFPVWFSSDVYAYATYGELARLGANPYAHQVLPHGNAVFEAAFPQWGNPPPVCVYGPLFVEIARVLVQIAAPLGVRAQLDAFRLLASVSLLACTGLAYLTAGGDRPRGVAAAVAIGLNPVLIWTAAEGHNDAVMMAIVLASFVALRRYGPGVAAFVAALAALVKIPGAIAAVGIAIAASGGGRKRAIAAWLGALAGLFFASVMLRPWADGIVHQIAGRGHYDPQASFQGIFAFRPELAISLAALAAAACAAYGALMLRKGEPDGWCALALGAWLLIPNPYPWYGLWVVAAALLAPRGRFSQTLMLLALLTPLRYLPDVAATLGPVSSAALAVLASLPLLRLFRPRATSADSAIISAP